LASFTFPFNYVTASYLGNAYPQISVTIPQSQVPGQEPYSLSYAVQTNNNITNLNNLVAEYNQNSNNPGYFMVANTSDMTATVYAQFVGADFNQVEFEVYIMINPTTNPATTYTLEGTFSGGSDEVIGDLALRETQLDYAKKALASLDCYCPTIGESC